MGRLRAKLSLREVLRCCLGACPIFPHLTACTKCISVLPELAEQTSKTVWTSVRKRLAALVMGKILVVIGHIRK